MLLTELFGLQHIDVTPKDEDKSFLTFIIPHEKEKLLEVSTSTRILEENVTCTLITQYYVS